MVGSKYCTAQSFLGFCSNVCLLNCSILQLVFILLCDLSYASLVKFVHNEKSACEEDAFDTVHLIGYKFHAIPINGNPATTADHYWASNSHLFQWLCILMRKLPSSLVSKYCSVHRFLSFCYSLSLSYQVSGYNYCLRLPFIPNVQEKLVTAWFLWGVSYGKDYFAFLVATLFYSFDPSFSSLRYLIGVFARCSPKIYTDGQKSACE